MKESFSSEHGSELFGDSFKEFLNGGGVANEGGGHLETSGRDVTHGGLHVVGDPFDEVSRVLSLNLQHLFIYLHRRKGLGIKVCGKWMFG